VGKHNTFNDQVQPPDDFIDFTVSDTFRDHYAAQNLTYPSGRKNRQLEIRQQIGFQKLDRTIKALARERDDWMSRAMESEGQCAQLKEKYERLKRQYSKYRGVDLDDCA